MKRNTWFWWYLPGSGSDITGSDSATPVRGSPRFAYHTCFEEEDRTVRVGLHRILVSF